MRALLLVLVIAAAGCHPRAIGGISVSPPAMQGLAAERANFGSGFDARPYDVRALEIATGVARRHGMQPLSPPESGWAACYFNRWTLCAKPTSEGFSFRFRQFMAWSLSREVKETQRDLEEALRAEFGSDAIRKCDWDRLNNVRLKDCRRRH